MRRTTVADAIKKLRIPKPTTIEREISLLLELPEDIDAPCITFHKNFPTSVSFSGPSYDPDNTYDPIALISTIESAGWKTLPATLVQWGDYRRRPMPGTQDELPAQNSAGDTLTDSEPIIPAWIEISNFTGAEVHFFMESPSGLVCKIHVDLKGGFSFYLTAHRKEYRGGWYYEWNTASIRHSDKAYDIKTDKGNALAGQSQHSRAYLGGDTYRSQSIDGVVYWTAEVDNFPLSVSEIVAAIKD